MAFSARTWYTISKSITDVYAELEQEVNLEETNQLTKHYQKDTDEWYKAQLNDINKFSKRIEKIANEFSKKAIEKAKEALTKAVDAADKETIASMQEVAGIQTKEIDSKDEFIASAVERYSNFNTGEIKAFITNAVNRNSQFINNIKVNSSNLEATNVRIKSGMWNKTQGLYDVIRKQTEEGIKFGTPITYSNGRRVSFKAHMEMSVRTLIQNETTERMEKATQSLGIIFFLATEHADSADDHAAWQGRLYINDNWESVIFDEELKSKIRDLIKKKDIRTLQWIKGAPVYFTTRPNCRHKLIPISIAQALGNIDELKSKLKTKKGDYVEENYKDLKQQRYNERAIRFYKERYNNNLALYNNTDDPLLKQEILRDVQKDSFLIKKWQGEQRNLILSNKNLMREYRRESANKMAQDLGVKLNLDPKSKEERIRKIEELKERLKPKMQYREVNKEVYIYDEKYIASNGGRPELTTNTKEARDVRSWKPHQLKTLKEMYPNIKTTKIQYKEQMGVLPPDWKEQKEIRKLLDIYISGFETEEGYSYYQDMTNKSNYNRDKNLVENSYFRKLVKDPMDLYFDWISDNKIEIRKDTILKSIEKQAVNLGAEYVYKSDSGSKYLKIADVELRLSDHYLPDTAERNYNRQSGGPRWDNELVIDSIVAKQILKIKTEKDFNRFTKYLFSKDFDDLTGFKF